MAERIRVQKALANAGLMSRRAAEEAIKEGRVQVDGVTAILGDRVDVEAQTVTLDRVLIPVDPELETYLLYKPVGVISTADDPHGRPTVVELVSSTKRLYPVGRLDQDSEGLILVTNDGELANRVTHPRYGITKKYVARLDRRPDPGQIRSLLQGVELDDGPARALSAKVIGEANDVALVELVMGEGRNREIRRMFERLGLEVTSLVRVAIGKLSDRRLKPGQSRLLTPAEIQLLLGPSEVRR
ncbi:MAG: pseudouridine synthase [Acidimicrobiia bacterium]